MLDLLSSVKDINSQDNSEKIYILKMIAHQMLGPKWIYYRKIKHAGEGFKLFREKTLMEQMKATQAALRFTSKHAKKLYRNVYKNCTKDVKINTGFRDDSFEKLPEFVEGQPFPSLTSKHDEVIMTWAPIKFFLPAKTIREKGIATQRHSEGLVAKLFFKIAGFYAAPENWEEEKLTFYLRKLTEDSNYQDVSSALSPLREDLQKFTELNEPFKFGKASLSKDKTADEGVFDDTFGVESFEDELRTLYWYHFIYWGIESFLFRYYLILVTSTESRQAIKYLTQIFEPALLKAIEIRTVFLGSFETDRTKKKYRIPYRKLENDKQNEPLVKKIKTQNGLFESYTYNLTMLEKNSIGYQLDKIPDENSEWGHFIRYTVLNATAYKRIKSEMVPEPIPFETTQYALMHIFKCMVGCAQFEKRSRHKVLERFKKRVETDKELMVKRIKDIRRRGEKQVSVLERKVLKLRRMKQGDAAEVFQRDIDVHKKKVEEKCDEIQESTQLDMALQKRRLQSLFQELSQEQEIDEGISARYVLNLIKKMVPHGDFVRDFTKQIATFIQQEYDQDMEPFYKNLFSILHPSTQEKVILIQSLEKAGEDNTVQLTLTDEEKEKTENMVNLLKAKIKGGMPDIFNCKVIFQTSVIPVDDLFRLSIDNKSLKVMLSLKTTSPSNAKPTNLQEVIVKALLVLNLVTNPVPKHSLIQPGRGHMKDPQQVINQAILNQLLEELKNR